MPGQNALMRDDVTLRPLDEGLLRELLDAAVDGADPSEVMPPVEGPAGWTAERRAAFLRFHRSRSLSAAPVEITYAVFVGGTVAGAARLGVLETDRRAAEAGVWLSRSQRGRGVGGAVLGQLLGLARAEGFTWLFVSTEPDNAAVRRLLLANGADVVPAGETVTAWIDLGAGGQAGQ